MRKSRTDLLQACRNYLQVHELVQPGQSVLLAVSGGVDSMVLCALLRELAGPMALRLALAHFNHHLRGAESDEDERFVLRMAAEWGFTVHTSGADVASWSDEQRQRVETGARILRYRFLLDLAEKMGYDRVATGHNADDQAETVLDHFLRGSGVTGLCGMPRRRERIIRPLLFADRRWISAFAEQHAVPFRRDSSNEDQAYRRNRLRHELLPYLQQYNPRIHRTLTRLSDNMAEVDEYLTAMAEKAFGECCIRAEGGKIILDCQLFLAYFIILKKYLLRLCLSKLVAGESFFDHALYDRALSIVSGTGDQAYAVLGSRVFIERAGKVLIIGRRPLPCAEVRIDQLQGCFPLWDGWRLSILAADEPLSSIRRNQDPKRVWVDGDKLTLPLYLRPMRDADRFRPLHLAGSKSLSDFFIDEKIPRHLRRRIPILWSGDQVVWVCGRRLDDRFKVTAETTRVYELKLVEQCESKVGI